MKMKQDSPGVYIPPPLIYVLIFIAAIFIQKRIHIDDALFRLKLTREIGILFLIAAIFFLATSLADINRPPATTAKTPELCNCSAIQYIK